MTDKKSAECAKWFFPFYRSMRFRITFGIVGILSLILLILGRVTIFEQRERMMAQMNSYGAETAGFISQISIVPIQKFSYYQLENYVAQLEQGQLISYCEIYDKEGNPLAHSTREKGASAGKISGSILPFSVPIRDGSTQIGRVELGLNLEPVLAKIDTTSRYITIAFWLELFLIAAAVSIFVHRSLVAPILRLTETTQEIADGKFISSPQSVREDEVGTLAKSINAMSRSLEESYRTLERKVAERTAALSAAKNASEETAKNLELVSSNLQVLLDSSPVGIAFVSSERIVLRVNLEFSRIFGYSSEEIVGKNSRMLYAEQQAYDDAGRAAFSVLRSEGFCQVTVNMTKKDGTTVVCALRGRHTRLADGKEGVVWSIEDITFRLKMEEELLKVKKLESIGVLAGGIAHDFNNILVAIIGNISLAERLLEESPKVVNLLNHAKNASLRAKDLTIKLLTFAKGGDPVISVEHLPEIIIDSASFVLSGSNVRCVYDFDDKLWPVPMDKGQINQVVQNLVLNADQSMPDGGTITIACRNMEVGENEVRSLEADTYVCMTIADSGTGINKDHISNIFDPYFSTKEKSSDKGSGLGLSIVHSIVTKHKGHISVHSVAGQGTTFTLYFPAASEHSGTKQQDVLPPSLAAGKGRILVMDDEETIQVVAGEMLRYLGYEVLAAKDGEEAIAIYSDNYQSEQRIDIVIMDLTIPGGMGGKEAVKRILQIDRDAKVIVSSGYSDDPLVQNYREAGFISVISKPYQLTDLSEILARTMDS